MQVTFLGTSAGVPTLARNVSAVALRLPERAEVWLFDCGEGTQHQLLRSDLKISRIARIFITHLHGDHVYGLLGLLASCGLAGHVERLNLYGPPGLRDYVESGLEHSLLRLPFPIQIQTAEAGLLFDDGQVTVSCLPLRHRVPSFGYRVEEHDRPGELDAERACELGVPVGPLLGLLKRGETVRLDDGRLIDGRELVGPPQQGRRLAYCTDTIYCDSAVTLAREVDLLIHEATFAQRDAELAAISGHSTAASAARVALEAGALQLALTHISSRYLPGAAIGPDALLAEARAIFPATLLADDFTRIVVRSRGGQTVAP
jgi:ribonuclease Z